MIIAMNDFCFFNWKRCVCLFSHSFKMSISFFFQFYFVILVPISEMLPWQPTEIKQVYSTYFHILFKFTSVFISSNNNISWF